MVTIDIIHPLHLEREWPQVAPLLDVVNSDAMNLYGLDDIKRKVNNGDWVLAVARAPETVGAAVFYFDMLPRGKVLHILVMSGSGGEKWLDEMFNFVENVAQLSDCILVTASGRKGWQKKRPDYSVYCTTYMKEVRK